MENSTEETAPVSHYQKYKDSIKAATKRFYEKNGFPSYKNASEKQRAVIKEYQREYQKKRYMEDEEYRKQKSEQAKLRYHMKKEEMKIARELKQQRDIEELIVQATSKLVLG